MSSILISNIRIFNGRSASLSEPSHILISGNKIQQISTKPISKPAEAVAIDGGGRVLTPGFIDAHVHLGIVLPLQQLMAVDPGYLHALIAKGAKQTLMRGFTTVRDMAGPMFGLKKAIDEELLEGPRIYASGAAVTQTSGHGDFRGYTDLHKNYGGHTPMYENQGWTFLADGVPAVLAATRENLRKGASQIKVMAGGGIASEYDPLDVCEYTAEELKAAVDAAADWGTYVAVHVYNAQGIRRALDAGVKSIEHAHLVDETTMKMMADKGAYLSTQGIAFHMEPPGLNADQKKGLGQAQAATDMMMALAKKHKVKVAWGTDLLGDLRLQAMQNKEFSMRLKWFTPAEILIQATSMNAELMALSGNRNPYPGKLGVIEEGAYADVLLVDGNPLENIQLLENPDKNLFLIVKDGKIRKNSLI